MSTDKYCRRCGKEKIKEPTGRFNPETGEAELRTVCVDDCKHGLHGWSIVRGPKWAIGFLDNYACPKCGEAVNPD